MPLMSMAQVDHAIAPTQRRAAVRLAAAGYAVAHRAVFAHAAQAGIHFGHGHFQAAHIQEDGFLGNRAQRATALATAALVADGLRDQRIAFEFRVCDDHLQFLARAVFFGEKQAVHADDAQPAGHGCVVEIRDHVRHGRAVAHGYAIARHGAGVRKHRHGLPTAILDIAHQVIAAFRHIVHIQPLDAEKVVIAEIGALFRAAQGSARDALAHHDDRFCLRRNGKGIDFRRNVREPVARRKADEIHADLRRKIAQFLFGNLHGIIAPFESTLADSIIAGFAVSVNKFHNMK